jgi:hypothetical protein
MKNSVVLEAIGLLQCAESNCENIARLGPEIGAKVVRMQIQQALKVLGGQLVTEDVEVATEVRSR